MASNVAHKQLICDALALFDAYDYMHVLMSCDMHICDCRSKKHILNITIFSQRYDFTNKGSSSNVGLAYVSGMCSDQSVSVVEDHFDFAVLTSAAHELGHGYSIKKTTFTIVRILFFMCISRSKDSSNIFLKLLMSVKY